MNVPYVAFLKRGTQVVMMCKILTCPLIYTGAFHNLDYTFPYTEALFILSITS